LVQLTIPQGDLMLRHRQMHVPGPLLVAIAAASLALFLFVAGLGESPAKRRIAVELTLAAPMVVHVLARRRP
jgi:hypothetical protein